MSTLEIAVLGALAGLVLFVPNGVYFWLRGPKAKLDYLMGGYLVDRSKPVALRLAMLAMQWLVMAAVITGILLIWRSR